MTKTRSNEFISNLKIEYNDGSLYATYIRNSDGKELHSVVSKRFNGFDIESCKNMMKDLENLKVEQLRERIKTPDESRSQKFDRYISETKAIDQIIDNYTRIESTLSPQDKMDKILDHAEFIMTSHAMMSEFKKEKFESYKRCNPSFQRTTPSKEDINQLTQNDLIDLLNENERLKSQLLSK